MIKMSEMRNKTWITQMRTFLIEFKSLSVIVSIELKVTGTTLLLSLIHISEPTRPY